MAVEYGENIEVYKTRFWILGIFSLICFMQTVVWGTFGPIMESAEYAFGWPDSVIAVLQSLGPTSVIMFIVPATWFNQTYGLRKGILGVVVLLTFGTGVRCITSSDTAFTALAIVGGIATGISGCITLSLPAMISATWFPPQERTTATAIGALSAQLGGAGMYLSPFIVSSPNDTSGAQYTVDEVKDDIMLLMYLEFSIMLVLFICVIMKFPEKPKFPPSKSSGIQRENYFQSIRDLSRNKEFLLVLSSFSFSFGIPVVWISVMNFSLQCVGIHQDDSTGIAVTACLASAILSTVIAMATDRLYGYLKISIIALLLASSICFIWFLLLINEFITPSLGQFYASVSGGISLEYASVPLLMELGVELGYPCSEGVVGASFTGAFNIISAVFLLLFIIPTECYFWASYALVSCTLFTTVPLFFVQEKHHRSSLDGK